MTFYLMIDGIPHKVSTHVGYDPATGQDALHRCEVTMQPLTEPPQHDLEPVDEDWECLP